MKVTKKDYEERKARVDNGEGSDEDARLVKQYERENAVPTAEPDVPAQTPSPPVQESGGGAPSPGSSTTPSADRPQRSGSSTSGSRPSRARTTENPST